MMVSWIAAGLATATLVLAGCATTDMESRKHCTHYEEELYTQHVCAEVALDCDYDLSGRQLCRTGECAKEVEKLATRQVCTAHICKEGYIRYTDGECYTQDEIDELKKR